MMETKEEVKEEIESLKAKLAESYVEEEPTLSELQKDRDSYKEALKLEK